MNTDTYSRLAVLPALDQNAPCDFCFLMGDNMDFNEIVNDYKKVKRVKKNINHKLALCFFQEGKAEAFLKGSKHFLTDQAQIRLDGIFVITKDTIWEIDSSCT